MPLKIPKIDDEDYEKLLEELRARLSAHAPEWTDFNDAETQALLEGIIVLLAQLSEKPEILDRLREEPAALGPLVFDLDARLKQLAKTRSRNDKSIYTVDRESGRIQFGDGERGRIPPARSTKGSVYQMSRRKFGLMIAGGTAAAAVAAVAGGIAGYLLKGTEIETTTLTRTMEKTVTSTIDRPTTHTTTHIITETHSVPHTVTQEETRTLTTTRTATSEAGTVPVGMVRSDSVQEAVEKAIELAGGLKGLEAGMTVMIKPNVNSDDPYPATTNPQVVAAIVNAVKTHNPNKVLVADCSNQSYWPTVESMKKTGIYQSAIETGAEVIGLEEGQSKRVKPEEAVDWPDGFTVPSMLDEVDYLITVPVGKTHYIATYSMALKNTVGLIKPTSRSMLHSYGEPRFGRMIAEINLARPADYVILDATKVFVTGGPFRGQAKVPGIVIATPDLVAADVSGLALLKHLGTTAGVQGKSVWNQVQIRRATELGLGVANTSQIAVASEGIEEIDEIKRQLM